VSGPPLKKVPFRAFTKLARHLISRSTSSDYSGGSDYSGESVPTITAAIHPALTTAAFNGFAATGTALQRRRNETSRMT